MLVILVISVNIISGALSAEQFEIDWSQQNSQQQVQRNDSFVLSEAAAKNGIESEIQTWVIGEIDWSQHQEASEMTHSNRPGGNSSQSGQGENGELTTVDKPKRITISTTTDSPTGSIKPATKETTQQSTKPATQLTTKEGTTQSGNHKTSDKFQPKPEPSTTMTSPLPTIDTVTEKPVKLTKNMISRFQQNLRKFAGELFYEVLQITPPGNNVFFSPTSISHAIAMINAGARGNSSQQIKQSLKFEQETSQELIDTLFKTVTDDKFSQKKKSDVIVKMASRGFIKKNFPVKKSFKVSLMQYYNSGIENMNFGKPKTSKNRINGWVQQNTNDLIKDLIPDSVINGLTRLILVNALYFKAPWISQFYETEPRDFNTPTGPVKVPFLYLRTEFKVLENNNHVYIGIPYKDKQTFFFIIMPKSDKALKKYEKKGNLIESFAYLRRKIVRDWKYTKVTLIIPKFTTEQELDLVKVLPRLGVHDIFSKAAADLSGITNKFLYVTDFLHKARITVNKEGTEAAAASAAATGARSLTTSYIINRPFIFGVFETDGDILFMGKMVNPSQK